MDYRIVSADDHIDLTWLPKDLWQKRVQAQWRGRAPKVVDTSDGPYWTCDGDRWESWGGRRGAAGAQGGRRTALERGGVLEPGVLRPTTTSLRLADMDRDGIDAAVLFPSLALFFGPLDPIPAVHRHDTCAPELPIGGSSSTPLSPRGEAAGKRGCCPVVAGSWRYGCEVHRG